MTSSILIVSLARCGSSALFELISQNLPPGSIGFFEPDEDETNLKVIDSLNDKAPVVVKVLLRPYLLLTRRNELQFQKTIGLIRDPRDNLISRLLFRMVSKKFLDNREVYQDLLPLIERKIEDPSSISVVKLFRAIESTNLMEKMIDFRFQENLNLFMKWSKSCESNLLYRYEDFVEENYSEISKFLGMKIAKKDELKVVFPAIKRSCGTGEWKHWFTPEDIDFFRPRMNEYMNYFGYEDIWETPRRQNINPSTSLDYLKKYIG
jgi:hypothetical protein